MEAQGMSVVRRSSDEEDGGTGKNRKRCSTGKSWPSQEFNIAEFVARKAATAGEMRSAKSIGDTGKAEATKRLEDAKVTKMSRLPR